jgi:hypothetical protein
VHADRSGQDLLRACAPLVNERCLKLRLEDGHGNDGKLDWLVMTIGRLCTGHCVTALWHGHTIISHAIVLVRITVPRICRSRPSPFLAHLVMSAANQDCPRCVKLSLRGTIH